MTPDFTYELLNALNLHIAVLDSQGIIIAVNDKWKNFAGRNGGDDKLFYIGANYHTVCENAVRTGGGESAEAVLRGINALLHGEKDNFTVEYPCHSPDEQRWFNVQVARFMHEGSVYLVTIHEDFTARKLAEIKLRESESLLSRVLETLPVGVWIMDQKGRIVHGNPAGQEIWGGARFVGPEEFDEYKGWWVSTGQRIAAEEWAASRAINKGETSIDEEIRIECFDGNSKIILNSAAPLRDGAGRVNGAIIVNQDITSRKKVEEQLIQANKSVDKVNRELQRVLERERVKARTDDLTGLYNRLYFHERSEPLFAVAHRYGTPLSIVIFDIDHFKLVNDLFGHQTGDTVLQEISRIASRRVRDADILARYGGEEFIIILPNTNAHEAFAVAQDIREKIAEYRKTDNGINVEVTISAGIAEISPDDASLDSLIQRADLALYEAKNSGRNCCRLYTPAS